MKSRVYKLIFFSLLLLVSINSVYSQKNNSEVPKDEFNELDDLSSLPDYLEKSEATDIHDRIITGESFTDVELNSVAFPAELEQYLNRGIGEALWDLHISTDPLGKRTYSLKKTDENLAKIIKKKNSWANFSLAGVNVLNAENNFRWVQIGWTPYFHINGQWKIRGQVAHFTHQSGELKDPDEYEVYDYASFLQYHEEKIYFEGGIGVQNRGEAKGGNSFLLGGGIGIKIDNKFLNLIDRFFINFISMANSEGSREIRLGLGIDFF